MCIGMKETSFSYGLPIRDNGGMVLLTKNFKTSVSLGN